MGSKELPNNQITSENPPWKRADIREIQMEQGKLVVAVLFVLSLGITCNAEARPNMTEEQLAKARQTASQLKPPVNLDELLNEAERLGVVCDDDLTRRIKIATCNEKVKTAQSKERQDLSKERQAKIDADNARLDEELRKKVNALGDTADQKLND